MELKQVDPEASKVEQSTKPEEVKEQSIKSDSSESKESKPSEPAAEKEPVQEQKQTAEEPKSTPPLPQRKPDLFASNLEELKQAFPTSDLSVCRGVLVASSNDLEHAFQGMLAISDETIRPIAKISKEQLLHDEKMARELLNRDQKRVSRSRTSQQGRTSRDQIRDMYNEENEEFIDTIQKGFDDTKQAVSSFWGSLKQKLANEMGDEDLGPQQPRRPVRHDRDGRPQYHRDAGYQSEPRPEQPRPVLPPRRMNTEEKSVNAFGDDSEAKPESKKDEPAADSDAFFIGESEDEDSNLNDSKAKDDTSDSVKAENTESADKSTNSESKESENGKDEKNSSAKDLLNKVKETK